MIRVDCYPALPEGPNFYSEASMDRLSWVLIHFIIFRPFFRGNGISVMMISGLRRKDDFLTRGWRRFFVGESTVDDKTEKDTNNAERDKEDW